ncbi:MULTISPECIES: toll/interleukin-1 receptor domain-containing protein [Rufibacter]|uniref:TIR domain-containing protein n=1 Tax=Rufibacter quisquiliarum TaxID=1549639 RepID=A0A839GX90_9BACT|nr:MULTISPECIES: toll/interleukin-1 receptor domain-containing protein [Rufibacter]MBA9079048.1 hypothetical protein [Rufibacter quisquiliarum]
MTLKEKSQLVEVIGTHLQGKFTAAQINSLLKRYRISFDKQTVVRNKKLYATGIIGPQSDDVIIKIAKYLKLDIPEEYKNKPKQPKVPIKSPPKSARLQKSVSRQIIGKKVFISHASADKDIVEKIIDLLKVMGVNSDKIFCTSFDGYGIDLGDNFLDALKRELNKDALVLFVFSKKFYESPICLCEMGAAWVTTKEHVPILIPPFGFADVKGVFPNTQGMILNDKDKINSLKERIEKFFSLTPAKHSIWERERNNILEEIDRRLNAMRFYY